MRNTDLNLTHLAASVGVDRVTLWRAVNNKGCSPALACRIHLATEGAIPCWQLRPDLWAEGVVPPMLASLGHHSSSSSNGADPFAA